jgi:hypothetical protein
MRKDGGYHHIIRQEEENSQPRKDEENDRDKMKPQTWEPKILKKKSQKSRDFDK